MEINNSRIVNFFQNYPNLHPETILLKFIDFYETINQENEVKRTPSDLIDYNFIINNLQTKLNNIIAPHLLSEQTTLTNIYSQLSQLTGNNKIPVLKGKVTENNYIMSLSSIFNDSEISDCSSTSHAMDILLQQPGKIDIRFDIKDYSTNVPSKEIQKFKNDITYNMCHGILISDKSGIATKQNYSFEIIDNKFVAFYISNGYQQMENIPNIISFIRCIESIINNNSGINISSESMLIIHKELENYISCLDSIKKNLQNSIQICNKMTFSSLLNILQYNTSSTIITKFTCNKCHDSFTTKRKLTYHLKSHS